MTISNQHWSAAAIEVALGAQRIALAPGRAARLVQGQQGLLGASGADPLLGVLDFHADVPAFLLAIERCKAR